MYKNSKWAQEILLAQNSDGLWGDFHTLSEPVHSQLTTEQALRRLLILGYTINDLPIRKTVNYLSDCLKGTKTMPDRREKTHDWDIFTELMLSTWIRKFTLSNDNANRVAHKWAKIVTAAFSSGSYNYVDYEHAYYQVFGKKPQGGRLTDFVSFYQISLLINCLDEKTERLMMSYVLNHSNGIYYIYDRPVGNAIISMLPPVFSSKQTSRYLGAIELLSKYQSSKDQLQFVVPWLLKNRNPNGCWDLGSKANDQVYFPLSDSWMNVNTRELDCTSRIEKLLSALTQ